MSDDLINEHVRFSYTNATLMDPFLSDVSKVTLNKNYLPLAPKDQSQLNSLATIVTKPPSYLTAIIEVYFGGSRSYSFEILFPQSASESLSAAYVKESPVGSEYPIVAFSNTNAQQISLDFVVLSDYLPTGYTFGSYLNALRKMVKPKIKSDSYIEGPEVYVSVANLKFSGVCDSVSINYDNLYKDNSYQKADVSCQFTVTNMD